MAIRNQLTHSWTPQHSGRARDEYLHADPDPLTTFRRCAAPLQSIMLDSSPHLALQWGRLVTPHRLELVDRFPRLFKQGAMFLSMPARLVLASGTEQDRRPHYAQPAPCAL